MGPPRLRPTRECANVQTRICVKYGGGLMAWWKRTKTEARDPAAVDPDMPLIRLEGITKLFKGDASGHEADTRALDNVTVDIDRGEYISISGPSGCGKSTML